MTDEEREAGKYIDLTLKMIKEEIADILTQDDFYASYRNHVIICDEQIFAKQKNLTSRTIYIVVKFGTASFDFGQALMPITINAVSEENGVAVCQKLLFDLATIYTQEAPLNNAEFPDDDYSKQIWNTPNVINNFNEVNVGFRSLFYMTGVVLIGHHSDPLEKLVFNLGEEDAFEINKYMITFSDSFDVYPDTQAFYTTNGIGKTAAKTASYAFSITLFKTSNVFMRLCKAVKRGDTTLAPKGIATKFKISMSDKDDYVIEQDPETGADVKVRTYWTKEYTLINMTTQQNKGDLPTVALTFAR